jgi:hypothetical protein
MIDELGTAFTEESEPNAMFSISNRMTVILNYILELQAIFIHLTGARGNVVIKALY